MCEDPNKYRKKEEIEIVAGLDKPTQETDLFVVITTGIKGFKELKTVYY